MNTDEALHQFQMKLNEAEKAFQTAIKIAVQEIGSDRETRHIFDAMDDVNNDSIYELRGEVEDIRSDVASYYFERDGFIAY